MRAREEAQELVRRAVRLCAGDAAQAALDEQRTELTRYAENRIAEGTRVEGETLCLRVQLDGREAGGCTTDLSEESVRALAEALAERARSASLADSLSVLPGPQQYPDLHPFNPSTALWTPQQRAESVRLVVEQAGVNGLEAAGAYYTQVRQLAVANSAGLEAAYASTLAGLTATAEGPGGGSGYGDGYARDVMQLNPLEIAEQAVSKALLGPRPVPVRPGEYEVVLEQNAVADLLLSLRGAFSARAAQEGDSFMSAAPGAEVTGPLVTITEDPLSPDGLHSPFDSEGVPRQRVELITSGVATGTVYDLRTAAREGRCSTGHAADPRSAASGAGPEACSLFMRHGDEDMETLIGAVERGLLVARLGDLEVAGPTGSVLSGVTRWGTFLIEGGVIARPVRDVRFKQDILEALRGVELASRERKLVVREGVHVVAPALKLRGLTVR